MNRQLDEQRDYDDLETAEWLESLDFVLGTSGAKRVGELIKELQVHAFKQGVRMPHARNTPYINSIHHSEQPPYPGNLVMENRIRSLIRWNAMAMVVKANRKDSALGGHISTFASSAAMLEVGFNHFFRAPTADYGGDSVYFQGHASPGIYARAFLEGRIDEAKLHNFRQEMGEGGGLSSYPHPRLMPDFWQFPTVSMGLGPIMAIYQARFSKYLESRGLKPKNGGKIWAFLGDGETDEPESLGAINLASREKLDNLIFVINCNLQRLDGPVRGNGKIIQELGGIFRGAGWKVLKLIWNYNWDALLEKDEKGILLRRMEAAVDGDYQKYSTVAGDYIRKHFFGEHPDLLKMVEHLSDEQLTQLGRGGHDPQKIYAAYENAVRTQGAPVVILMKTVKGYGMGPNAEGKNITHQQKKLNEEEIRNFRSRFNIPVPDGQIAELPFYRPSSDSPEIKYLQERREKLGGYLPERRSQVEPLKMEPTSLDEFKKSSEGRELSTTMAFVRILSKLLRDKNIGKNIVPIIPDEARTFGLEALFRQYGIYSSQGQVYEPVDKDSLLFYKESKDGQILEEGITESGAMCSFISAGTSYSNHGVPMIPFYIYYSMFGFQRIGDLAWCAGDIMARGFMLGATAGRTTLNGEGLQHQDGHSHVMAGTIPSCVAYDPGFAYELAIIILDGVKRMYVDQENVFYYLTVENENYAMPAMPEGCEEGVLKGIYKFEASEAEGEKVHLMSSGSILAQSRSVRELLEGEFGLSVDLWSVTSYNELRRDGLACERHNMLNPTETPKVPYLTSVLEKEEGIAAFVSDYMKTLPDSIRQWVPLPMVSLGTDGFGRSETRENLRHHFEIDAKHVAFAVLGMLHRQNKIDRDKLDRAAKRLGIDPSKKDPLSV